MLHTHNGILFSHKEKQNHDIFSKNGYNWRSLCLDKQDSNNHILSYTKIMGRSSGVGGCVCVWVCVKSRKTKRSYWEGLEGEERGRGE